MLPTKNNASKKKLLLKFVQKRKTRYYMKIIKSLD